MTAHEGLSSRVLFSGAPTLRKRYTLEVSCENHETRTVFEELTTTKLLQTIQDERARLIEPNPDPAQRLARLEELETDSEPTAVA